MFREKCDNPDKKIENRRIKCSRHKRSKKSLLFSYDRKITHLTPRWKESNVKTRRNIEKLIEMICVNINLGIWSNYHLISTKIFWKLFYKIAISAKHKITTDFKFLWVTCIILNGKNWGVWNGNTWISNRYGIFSLERVLMLLCWHEPTHHQECNTKNKKELKKLRRILLHGESYWVKLDETDDSNWHPEKASSKSLRRKMPYRFIEVMFASCKLIEYFCMKPSFKTHIHCIINDNEWDNESNHKVIRTDTMLDTQCCCHRRCQCRMRRRHPTRWKHQRDAKTTDCKKPYPLSNNRGEPGNSRYQQKMFKKVIWYGHKMLFDLQYSCSISLFHTSPFDSITLKMI